MAADKFKLLIENATQTDYFDLRKTLGESAVAKKEDREERTPFSFGELGTLSLMVMLVSTAGIVAWMIKQKRLKRTTLKITILDSKGAKTTIDFSDASYDESAGETKFISDIVKTGLKVSDEGHDSTSLE